MRKNTENNIKNNAGVTYGMDTTQHELHIKILAAYAATKEEVESAKQRMQDGSRPVITEKRPYRPKPISQYEEPAYLPDDDDTLEVLYRQGGIAVSKQTTEISEREPSTIIQYDERAYAKTLEKTLQWEDCPEKLRPPILELVKQYWDVFAQEGLKHHIRGFVCHIDTGNAQPVCCKIPRYGPHEARVITQLARGLEENGLIEEARSPWGAQVVLAAKPNQDHVHWSEYIWRLTVSYRKLNAVTRPFIYPSRRCDDAARDIGRSKYFITMDFESGFWQVLLHEDSRDKTAFFVPDGQKRWTVMPMGCLNAHGTFCCLVDTLKRQWNRIATEHGIRDDIQVTLKGERPWTDAEVIVDDIMLHSENPEPLIRYFEIVLQVLQKHQVTVKLKKCRFFPQSAKFVGMDVEVDGNRPARSKMQALEDLKTQPPNTVTDLRQLIGLIGFYQDWIANYELRIGRWRQHIKTLSATKPMESEANLTEVWDREDDELMKELIDELIARPTLARPDYTRRFYLKTDWCRLGMAAVLLQADPANTEAKEHETQETQEGSACVFDKHVHTLRLRPIAFSSRKCSEAKSAMHSYTGEATTGVWAIEKCKRHLFGKDLTWMTDCNGLRQFFEGEDVPTHMHQRMRQRLLRFSFTIAHRPAKFMIECDVLTRYNNITSTWRPTTPTDPTTTPIATTNQPVEPEKGTPTLRTMLATKSHNARNVWTFNAGATNIATAAADAGISIHLRTIEERNEWKRHPFDNTQTDATLLTIAQLQEIITPDEPVDWILAHDGCETEDSTNTELQFHQLTQLIKIGTQHNATAIIIFTQATARIHDHETNEEKALIDMRLEQLEATREWIRMRAQVHSNRYGAAISTEFTMIVATRNIHTLRTFHLQNIEATPLNDIISNLGEPNEPNVTTATEIRAMQRPPHTTTKYNEPRIAALIQRHGQDTNTRDWTTAWTPCYDTNHPGPDLCDINNQWYESPFAIETTTHDHTSTVRGIRHHELVDIIGYDEKAR